MILVRFGGGGESTNENPANRKILMKFAKNIVSCLGDFVAAPDTIKPRLFAEILKLIRILSKIPAIADLISAKIGDNLEDLTKSGVWNRQPWKKFASPIVKALHKAPYYVVKEILQNARGKNRIVSASIEENDGQNRIEVSASIEENAEVPEKIPKLE